MSWRIACAPRWKIAEAEASGGEGRVDQELDDAAVQELDQPLRCIQEVEGVLAGGVSTTIRSKSSRSASS